MTPHHSPPIIRYLGLRHYTPVFEKMKAFTAQRTEKTPDELWVLEHFPVFTQGLAGDAEHMIKPADAIPVVYSDRGGQITYHGPGQLIIYTLLNLKHRKSGIRDLVSVLENAVIQVIHNRYGLQAYAKPDARGVYINSAKIASIGLRVRRHCTYHGLALNVNMDITPFSCINPCGFKGLAMTQLADWDNSISIAEIAPDLVTQLHTLLHSGS